MKRFVSWLRGIVDRRDVLGLAGLGSLGYGGEVLMPGLGFALAGGVAVAVAVFGVR